MLFILFFFGRYFLAHRFFFISSDFCRVVVFLGFDHVVRFAERSIAFIPSLAGIQSCWAKKIPAGLG